MSAPQQVRTTESVLLRVDASLGYGLRMPTGRAAALNIERGVFTAVYQDRRDVLQAAPTGVPAAPRVPVPR